MITCPSAVPGATVPTVPVTATTTAAGDVSTSMNTTLKNPDRLLTVTATSTSDPLEVEVNFSFHQIFCLQNNDKSLFIIQICKSNNKKEEMNMANRGWMINLSGASIPVYSMLGNGAASSTQVGTLTKNECFAEGSAFGAGWEGIDSPVVFLNASHDITFGVIKDQDVLGNLADFADYASNGTSWLSVSTLERKVQYATVAYYADGSKCCDLAAGSRVWLTQKCTRGETHPNYVAVTSVQTATGKKYNFSGNGFVDLTYGGRWVNVGSILLRKV